MIANIEAQSKVAPEPQLDSRAKVEVECAGTCQDRGLAEEVLGSGHFPHFRRDTQDRIPQQPLPLPSFAQ